jgi:hypothetical protein
MRKFYEKLEDEEIVQKFAHKSTGSDKSDDSYDSSRVLDMLEEDSEHEEKASPEGSEEELGALG